MWKGIKFERVGGGGVRGGMRLRTRRFERWRSMCRLAAPI